MVAPIQFPSFQTSEFSSKSSTRDGSGSKSSEPVVYLSEPLDFMIHDFMDINDDTVV